MNPSLQMNIELKDVYQMLIAECRYAYKRNNHLTPFSAYERVKKLIPEMTKVDQEYATYTVKQLCEECIDDELILFTPETEDECGNRKLSIRFIEWCFTWIHQYEPGWKPWNYDMYLRLLGGK